MKLENQVVSLDLAKRLKELGFKQESLFYYSKTYSKMMREDGLFQLLDKNHAFYAPAAIDYKLETISAYTVAELGEMLPSSYTFEDTTCHITIEKDLNWWTIKYNSKTSNWCEEKNINEADARAKMLIYLKENNLI